LVGNLLLHKQYAGKMIPYKYVVVENSAEIWEHIQLDGVDDRVDVNRCLVVPEGVCSFTKFDDIIFKSDRNKRRCEARERATLAMLPNPSDFDNPEMDFDALLQRFRGVVNSHGKDGTKVCVGQGQVPKLHPFNPQGYSVETQIQKHLNFLLKNLSESLAKPKDFWVLLRMIIYIVLVNKTRIFHAADADILFKAIYECHYALFDDQLLKHFHEIQHKVAGALKKLVTDFVSNPQVGHLLDGHGNWIFAVPFIHQLDQSENNDWLNIKKWKNNLHPR
jgi:hypothetical protein